MSRPGKFDPEMVQRIRWYANTYGPDDAALADALGCSRQEIYNVRTRRSYAGVPDASWSAEWLLDEARDADARSFAAERERRTGAWAARSRRWWLERATAAGLP